MTSNRKKQTGLYHHPCIGRYECFLDVAFFSQSCFLFHWFGWICCLFFGGGCCFLADGNALVSCSVGFKPFTPPTPTRTTCSSRRWRRCWTSTWLATTSASWWAARAAPARATTWSGTTAIMQDWSRWSWTTSLPSCLRVSFTYETSLHHRAGGGS